MGADPRSANLFLRDDRSGGFAYLLWLCIRPTGLGSHQALHSAGAWVWELICDRRIFFSATIDLVALRIFYGSVFAQRGWAPTRLCTLRGLVCGRRSSISESSFCAPIDLAALSIFRGWAATTCTLCGPSNDFRAPGLTKFFCITIL